MMLPGKRLCDLCKNEIPAHVRYLSMSYPLDRNDHQLLEPAAATADRDVFPGLRILTFVKPEVFVFEFCRACVDGILPMLAELKTEAIKRLVNERTQHRRLQEEL
jgi:hypothetical protein